MSESSVRPREGAKTSRGQLRRIVEPSQAIRAVCNVVAGVELAPTWAGELVQRQWDALEAEFAGEESSELPNSSVREWLAAATACVRSSTAPFTAQAASQRDLVAAAQAVSGDLATVTWNDLWQWTEMIGWSLALGKVLASAPPPSQFTGPGRAKLSPVWKRCPFDSTGRFHFLPDEVRATEELLEVDVSQVPSVDALRALHIWVDRVSTVRGVPAPHLSLNAEASKSGGGRYEAFAQAIEMSVFNEEVLLHEYRHHLQYCGTALVSSQMETDAQMWSRQLLATAQAHASGRSLRGRRSRLRNSARTFQFLPGLRSSKGHALEWGVCSPQGDVVFEPEALPPRIPRPQGLTALQGFGAVIAKETFGSRYAEPAIRTAWKNRHAIMHEESDWREFLPPTYEVRTAGAGVMHLSVWNPDTFTALYVEVVLDQDRNEDAERVLTVAPISDPATTRALQDGHEFEFEFESLYDF